MGCIPSHSLEEALEDFLQNESDLLEFWQKVDGDHNKVVDTKELDMLLHVSLNYFQKVQNLPELTKEGTKVYIDSIRQQLLIDYDFNNDGVLDEQEFQQVGKYLKRAYSELLKDER